MPPHHACDAAGTDLSAGQGRNGRALVCDAILANALRMGGLSLGREDCSFAKTPHSQTRHQRQPHKTPPSSPNTLETHTPAANSLTPPQNPHPSTSRLQAPPVQAQPKICDTSGLPPSTFLLCEFPPPTHQTRFRSQSQRSTDASCPTQS